MNRKTNDELLALVHKATEGDKKALETLVADVQDIVFNLSLRMLNICGCGGCRTGYPVKNDYTFILF